MNRIDPSISRVAVIGNRNAISIAGGSVMDLFRHLWLFGIGVLYEVSLLVVVTIVIVVGGSGILWHISTGHFSVPLSRLVVLVLRLEVRRRSHPSGTVDGHSTMSASVPVDPHRSDDHDDNEENKNGEKCPPCATHGAHVSGEPTLRVVGSLIPINKHVEFVEANASTNLGKK